MGFWITSIEGRSRRRQDLVEELTAAQAEIAALNREAGTVVERERLARELHDTLAQTLTGIVMLAERARGRHPGDVQLAVLEDAAREALTETRGLVAAGASVPLDGGLAGAMTSLAGRFARETGLDVVAQVQVEVPRGLEVVLLRCAQEGLANVRKHARATRVALLVAPRDDEAVLTVSDDGIGPGAGDGFGLAGMRDRIGLVGGALELRAGAEAGTILEVRVPLEPVHAS
jgi:signal transduction histidine kinase